MEQLDTSTETILCLIKAENLFALSSTDKSAAKNIQSWFDGGKNPDREAGS